MGSNGYTSEQKIYPWTGITGGRCDNSNYGRYNGFVLFVGTGDTPPAPNDYKLENAVELGVLTASCIHYANGRTIIYNQETIWGAGTNASAGGSCGFVIDIYQNNLRFITSLYDNQPARAITLIYPLTINTEYEIKCKFTGTEYQLYVDDNLEAGITNSKKGLYNSSLNQNFIIGAWFNGETPISGSIDLSSCYININGENYWSPIKGTEQIL